MQVTIKITVTKNTTSAHKHMDYVAFLEGDEESGSYGYGCTEYEALAQFLADWPDDIADDAIAKAEREGGHD